MEDFRSYLADELGLRPNTVLTHVKSLRRAERVLGKPVEEITPTDARTIKRMVVMSTATKEATIVALRGLHQWALLEELPWASPAMLSVRVPRRTRSPGPGLEERDARRLLESCITPLEIRLVFLGLYQGTRVAESGRIDADSFRDGRLRFEIKGGRTIEVPVHPMVEEARPLLLIGGPVIPETLQNVRKRMTRKTGIEFTPHWLRRTFARKLEAAETPTEVIAELMGHARSVTTHYTRGVSFQRMERALADVDYFDGATLTTSFIR